MSSSLPESDILPLAAVQEGNIDDSDNRAAVVRSIQTMPSRRRAKPQLSCNPCRQRKSRCDRQQPCSSCTLRAQTCTYNSSSSGSNHMPSLLPKAHPGGEVDLQDRIAQLERLVRSVVPESAKKPATRTDSHTGERGPSLELSDFRSVFETIDIDSSDQRPADKPKDEQSECGSMRITASELLYVNGEHWTAILDSIADLKDHFDRQEQLRLAMSPDPSYHEHDVSAASEHSGALLLYGCRRPISRAEILDAIPPKTTTDRYISRYFNRMDLVASSVVHGPTFLREYEAFWAEPTRVPVIWIGLLFSMICLAVMASDASDYGSDVEQQRLQTELYRERIVQCLVVGGYTRSGPFVLETVIHYVYVEMLVRPDSTRDLWYLLGFEVSLAKRMGYHRDPRCFPDISAFQGEMRRRLWVTIMLGDILISSQMGLPRMISDWQCDTAEPQNLYDADLDDIDDGNLPAPRPETENTTALGVIARRRMLVALGAASDLTAAVMPSNYDKVMQVDATLHEAVEKIPPPLKMRSMAASMTDSPQIIMSRLFIRHMFYKGQIMLHRRYLYMDSDSAGEDLFPYSRNACLEASIGTLQIQHILDEETCPGGQLHMMGHRNTSIMNHGFLTATMILCSLLHRGHMMAREDEIKAILRKTRSVWMRSAAHSSEAKKGAEAVTIVLERADDSHGFDFDFSEDLVSSMTDDQPVAIENSEINLEVGFHDPTLFQGTVGQFDDEMFTMPGLFNSFTTNVEQESHLVSNSI